MRPTHHFLDLLLPSISMKITFLVNDPTGIQPSQTTAMLIAAAVAQGHQVGVVGVGDLSCRSDGQPWGQVYAVPEGGAGLALAQLMAAIAQAAPQAAPLGDLDLLLIRTNPARDLQHAASHQTALALARLAQKQGVRVVNQPDGLIRAASKLYLLELPDFCRPLSLVSQQPQEILRFIQALEGPAVLKPLQGTRGSDVFFVASAADRNLNQIMDVIARQGLVMVQRCIPGVERGDTRVVVLNGEILRLGGEAAAIARIPGAGDFRSNLHAGGRAEPAVITAAMEAVVVAIGPKLVGDGLQLVGLDFMGDQLLEVNVFSTGGLRDAERFTGKSFSDRIVKSLSESLHER
jgi:glutathione synthase